MNKIVKIGGVILVGIILLVLFLGFLMYQNSARNISQSSFGIQNSMMATGVADRGFVSPLSLQSSFSGKRMMEADSIENDTVSNVTEPVSQVTIEKKIIKNGSLSLKIANADKASEEIKNIARNNGGEVFASNFYQSSSDVKSGTMTVKVPVIQFEKTFSEIKKVASLVIRESTTGQDVTAQYTDLQAQISNAQAEEQTFVKILDQAVKIDDVLAVTRELARVRGTIERLEGNMKYLASQTDMSTISIDLTENQNITTVSNSWRPIQVMKDSVNALITSLQGFVDFLIRFVVILLPFFVIWGIIFWGLYKIGRKLYQKLTAKNE